jgi:cytochrome oxidase assembly protein ShyY1
MKIVRLYFSRRWWWTTLLMLLIVAGTIRLGIWQLDRMRGQQISNEHARSNLAAGPLDMNTITDVSELESMEYRSVTARGTYDFEFQIALRNQYWGDPDGTAEYGYHLLTPLLLDNGQAVLVDRGWIPGKYDSSDSWMQFDEDPQATVQGILRVPLSEGEMGGGVADPTAIPGESLISIWNYIDIERLQSLIPYKLLPVYIQKSPDGDALVLPYESSPNVDMSDERVHLGYALQWFGYAALVFFGYPFYLRRQSVH